MKSVLSAKCDSACCENTCMTSRAVFRAGREGFSLFELILVITIMGIIAAIAMPDFGTSSDIQVTSAAHFLARDIEAAQSLAIMRQVPHTVLFSGDLQNYKLVANYDGSSGYSLTEAIDHPVRLGALYQVSLSKLNHMEQVLITEVSFGASSYITFDELGEPAASGDVTLGAGDAGATVAVEALTGTVSVGTN